MSEVWRKIIRLTDELMVAPLHAYFSSLSDELRVEYSQKVSKPIDFDTIRKNVTNNVYSTPQEWNNDMELVYKNGMEVHKERPIWYSISQYCYNDFKKRAKYILLDNPQSVYDILMKKTKELNDLIANGPVPQGTDPFVISCVNRADPNNPPQSTTIADTVEKINEMALSDVKRREIINVIEMSQPEIQLDPNDITLDVDSLTPKTLNALAHLANARD